MDRKKKHGMTGRKITERMFQRLNEEAGYFIVEASFLVPIVCCLILGIAVIGIYICDLNQAKSFLNRRVTELSKDQEEYGTQARNEDWKKLESKLFLTEIEEFIISKSGSKVQGRLEVRMHFSVPLVGTWMGTVWKNEFSYSADIADHVKWMRRWDQLE